MSQDLGPVTVIGPECFASAGGSVICWQGVNYYREPDDDELARVFVAMDGVATEVPGEVRDSKPWKPYHPERFARLRGLRVQVRDWLWLRRVRKSQKPCERCTRARKQHPTWAPGELTTVHYVNNHDGTNPERKWPE